MEVFLTFREEWNIFSPTWNYESLKGGNSMDAIGPGVLIPIFCDRLLTIFICRDKEINGVLDPMPTVFWYTPESITKLTKKQESELLNEPEPEVSETIERFTVFDTYTVVWVRRSIFEGAFAGTSVTYRGPYLLKE
jgi:hypothetical protein